MVSRVQQDLSRKHKWFLIGLLYLFSTVLILVIFGLRIWFESSLDAQRHKKTQLSITSELNRYQQEIQQILSGKKDLASGKKPITIDESIVRFVKQHSK